ncbi:MAG: FAD-dependent oxidoreductase [Stappiaceae bacterium]
MNKAAQEYDVIVIGRGLMGSAAARHLARAGLSIALIGPDEPADKSIHSGVFSSHYDEGRITRSLDGDDDWSLLSSRSIDRYHDIEQQSGIEFFSETGAMIAGREKGTESAYIAQVQSVQQRLGINATHHRGADLAKRFPYFRFEDGTVALHESVNAGHISPRRLVEAQTVAAQKSGATVIQEIVRKTSENSSGIIVQTDAGNTYAADKALLAAGYNSRLPSLADNPPLLDVYARTIAFFEVGQQEVTRLEGMPSLIFEPRDRSCDPYLLPPIRYPDGKTYIKIGGDPEDIPLKSEDEICNWFRSDGSPSVRDHLERVLFDLMPDLAVQSIKSGSCVTSYTATGKAIIQPLSDRLTVLTGGNGKGAKCSDELGRLAGLLLTGKELSAEPYQTDFKHTT